MYWSTYTDRAGRRWRVNQLGLWILVRQHVYQRLLRQRSRVRARNRLLGPNEAWVETDFRGINAERDRLSRSAFPELERLVADNPRGARQRLVQMRREAERDAQALIELKRQCSSETLQNIERSVRRGQAGEALARAVRDFSATTLVVGSSLVSGGAGLALLGAGSVFKGAASYQDKGNFASAIVETSGTFIVGALSIPAEAVAVGGRALTMSRVSTVMSGESIGMPGERVVLVLVGSSLDATFAGVNALIEGSTARDALSRAAGQLATGLLSGGWLGPLLQSTAMPVWRRLILEACVNAPGQCAAGMAAVNDGSIEVLQAMGWSSPMTGPSVGSGGSTTGAMSQWPGATICDANSVLQSGSCDAAEWIRQVVLQEA